MKNADLAEFIVKVLDLAGDRYPEVNDLDTPQLKMADRIKDLYGMYTRHHDFTTSAFKARVQVVLQILEENRE